MTALFLDLWNQNCKYKDMVFRFKGPVNKRIMRPVSITLKLNLFQYWESLATKKRIHAGPLNLPVSIPLQLQKYDIHTILSIFREVY